MCAPRRRWRYVRQIFPDCCRCCCFRLQCLWNSHTRILAHTHIHALTLDRSDYFGTAQAKLAAVADADADTVASLRAADALRAALAPPYTQLFHLIANYHVRGVAFLLRMRRDMLVALDEHAGAVNV